MSTKPSLPPFLINQIKNGEAVLFAGAGFSMGATGRHGPILSTDALNRILLGELGEPCQPDTRPPYTLTQSATLYLRRLGKKKLLDLYESYFKTCKPTSWHDGLISLPWYRIYTTNIDDIIERAFEHFSNERRLRVRNGLEKAATCTDGPQEVTLIKLHGTADGQSEVIFSQEEYALATAEPNYWLELFSNDFLERTMIFIGSSLSDSDLWHYINRRALLEKRSLHEKPEAFAVTPDLRPGFGDLLSPLKITHIRMDGKEFYDSIHTIIGAAPSVSKIARERVPFFGEMANLLRFPAEDLFLFSKQYLPIKFEILRLQKEPRKKSDFFLGREPTWADIVHGRDGARDLQRKVIDGALDGQHQLIVGAPGEGKSTLLMRVGKSLVDSGKLCYYFIGDSAPNIDFLERLLKSMPGQQVYMLVDRFSLHSTSWINLLNRLTKVSDTEKAQLVFVTTDRTPRSLDYQHLMQPFGLQRHTLGKLSEQEILHVIRALDADGMLGELQGRTLAQQIAEFSQRANKWLLVALREATRGKGFDEILADEYLEFRTGLATGPFLAVALAHMFGSPLPHHIFVSCLQKLNYSLDEKALKALQDAVERSPRGDYLTTRHPIIAEVIVHKYASIQEKLCVVVALISSLAAHARAAKRGNTRSATMLIYRQLMRHEALLEILGNDKKRVEEVYEEIKRDCSEDAHYWLQYGSLAIKVRDFDRAENYIRQSLRIQHLEFADHQLGLLYMLRAVAAGSIEEAREFYTNGWEQMKKVLDGKFADPAYPYATLLSVSAEVIERWGQYAESVVDFDRLRKICDEAWRNPVVKSNRKVSIGWKRTMALLLRAPSSSKQSPHLSSRKRQSRSLSGPQRKRRT